MNEDHIWLCVGIRGKDAVKVVLNYCSTQQYAERLFVAMYGVETIIIVKKPSLTDLYSLVMEREREMNTAVFDAKREIIRDWTESLPRSLKAEPRPKRKYTRRVPKKPIRKK